MNLPIVGKILGILVIMIISIMVLFFSSCGSTRTLTKVRNNAHGTITTITQSTSGSTISVDIKPDVSLGVDSLKINTR